MLHWSSCCKNDIYNVQPPLKTIEYLASGLPVIATNTIANQAVITDNANGILVDDDESALVEGITRLVSDHELRKRLASNAAISARDFTWDVSTRYKLEPAYRDILAVKHLPQTVNSPTPLFIGGVRQSAQTLRAKNTSKVKEHPGF